MEKVRDRLLRSAGALGAAGVPYAVAGPGERFRLLALDALVRMKLTSFRDKDRTHVRDMLEVGLLDASWAARLPRELATRLQQLIDNPE